MNGYSIGMALDISSACDIRLCSKDAKFTIKEIDLGICADLGVVQRF
jgi:delta(3,5)-delta(2,4)-dienoyl-CoA isomerase